MPNFSNWMGQRPDQMPTQANIPQAPAAPMGDGTGGGFNGGQMPSWMTQRNAWQDARPDMSDPALRQQWFQQRDAWQNARDAWSPQQAQPMAQPAPMPQPMPQPAVSQNWYDQNRPAIEQWFQQKLGVKPTGLFPFAPAQFPGRMG